MVRTEREVQALLSGVSLSGRTGPLSSRAHALYLIYSALALHNVNIILRYPGAPQPFGPLILFFFCTPARGEDYMEMNKESLQSCDTDKKSFLEWGGWFSVQMDEKLGGVSISQRHPDDICSTSG